MDSLAKPWVAFLNQFADALHKHDMILSVFIDGCCGYTNPYDTSSRGCKGVEANQDYQGAQCTMFANSSVDRWLSHATYGGGWHDTTPSIGPGGEVWTLKQMSAVGAKVIGVPAFSVGVKGGFSPPLLPLNKSAAKGLNCSESARTPPFGTLPEGCYAPFDEAGRKAIDAIHELGVQHVAKFMDEPRTEAEWAAWGYHLHGPP